VNAQTREYTALLRERLLHGGPEALTDQEKRTLLWDAEAMVQLHRELWSTPASQLHEWWQAGLRHYNEASAQAVQRSASAL
jgi:membrane glycosyltransferase